MMGYCTYHEGAVLLVVVAMLDLLSNGSGGFGGPGVGAIRRVDGMGVIRKYPVDCRLIEVASSGILFGRRGGVQGRGWWKTYPS